jgi:AAA+ ATPase superfamily predicted ATPase
MTGQVARKENFWDRKNELEDIWYKIESGSHILLVAPRRVGKTSIMYNILDNPKDDYIVLYIDTESANEENEFWKKLFFRLMEEDFVNTLQTKAKNFFSLLKTIKISELSTKGIKFGDGTELDYASAFKKVIKELDTDKRLIILIDEFALAIENIIKYEGEKSAQSLLKTHRELRQDNILLNKVTFMYAGSIGLESVASKINSIGLINDLSSIKVLPLELDDAKEFAKKLSESNGIEIEENEIEYLLNQIEWLIPFYIQLIMDELRKTKKSITTSIIDSAFDAILDNRNHFEHWHSRLKSLADNEYKFAKEILNTISEQMTMQSTEIINIASKYSLNQDEAKEIIHSLVYDGYINNNDNPKEYRFNSPILRMWWYKNVAN